MRLLFTQEKKIEIKMFMESNLQRSKLFLLFLTVYVDIIYTLNKL